MTLTINLLQPPRRTRELHHRPPQRRRVCRVEVMLQLYSPGRLTIILHPPPSLSPILSRHPSSSHPHTQGATYVTPTSQPPHPAPVAPEKPTIMHSWCSRSRGRGGI
ncbi:hypothetical protein EX30DRAFT_84442 [Ascodesmis nigricans]|uniref:Uncharacterized protein n=1 Tax=Ascodesmis nigricans TaxID=341454 RepID=A0A4S2N3L0_9PEZI|nr:hypothetical protein EX30DRAFT_84442 [Ascodesmis nigricans]